MCVIYIQVMEPGVCSGSKTIMCTNRAGECEIELESVYSGTPCMYGRVSHCLIVVQYVCVLWNTGYIWKGKVLLNSCTVCMCTLEHRVCLEG